MESEREREEENQSERMSVTSLCDSLSPSHTVCVLKPMTKTEHQHCVINVSSIVQRQSLKRSTHLATLFL